MTTPLATLRLIISLLIVGFGAGSTKGEISLSCDFTNPNDSENELYNFWSVNNFTEGSSSRMSPAITEDAKANLVRSLGGWRSGDISGDSCRWDGTKYVYDWTTIKKRIDQKRNAGIDIFQIVLDNPPWAFQRGFKFVDERNGKDYLQEDSNALYGNSLPPNDPQAWSDFIEALVKELIATYGRETVESWRFRVGTEIDTRPHHWSATMQQYFDHYKNTVQAVHRVLPTATIGAQFREASMKPKYVDYKGNIEPPYGPLFVAWAKQNDIHYDFIGTSFYPRYNLETRVDLEHMYAREQAPIAEHSDWRPGATFEVHEYKPITEIKEGHFLMLNTSHSAAFNAMFAKLIYEKGIPQVYQWKSVTEGLDSGESMTHKALMGMVGNRRFSHQKIGTPNIDGNRIDAIFSAGANDGSYSLLAFNYNTDPKYQSPESVDISMTLPVTPGTNYEIRSTLYDQTRNSFQQFVRDYPKAGLWEEEGGWVKNGFNKSGQLGLILNEEGVRTFEERSLDYVKFNELKWTEWRQGTTKASDSDKNSVATITAPLPSFSFHAYTLRIKN